ncbi:MAG: NAD-dependent epimerase/dehydratase family protein [Streptosporangiales bacterium]|nr:NAD-dependent epimerase/dehydratase family protein [Streptosporangiales bacterium]
MKTLITGGRGFLARVVATYLRNHGHDVWLLSRSAAPGVPEHVRLLQADLRNRQSVRAVISEPFDAVVHLAGLGVVRDSIADPMTYFDVNTAGTINLLLAIQGAAPDRCPAFLFASTQTVYGTQHQTAMPEELPPAPEHPYAMSKLAAEQVVAAQAATGALRATTLRLVNLAGALDDYGDDNTRGVIPKTLHAAASSATFTVNGDGSTVRDFVHVTDVANAIALAIDTAKPGEHAIYNIGSGKGSSVAEIIRTVEAVTGRSVPVEHLPAVPEPPCLVVDNQRARALLGWHPTRSTLDTVVRDAWHAMNLTA